MSIRSPGAAPIIGRESALGQAAVLLAGAEPHEAARLAHESAAVAAEVAANLQAAFSRSLEARALIARKLGVSSRAEVARAYEREVRRRAGE